MVQREVVIGQNKVVIHWLPNARKQLPTPPRYSTIARFGNEMNLDAGEAWSVILEFAQNADATGKLMVDIRFLAPDAPQELLHEGSRFALYEGAKKVAEGEIIHSHSV